MENKKFPYVSERFGNSETIDLSFASQDRHLVSGPSEMFTDITAIKIHISWFQEGIRI